MKHLIYSSMGKDSMATIILAYITKQPIDSVVYCEVMFDEKTSGEVPEHAQFIHNIAIPRIRNDFGFGVEVIRSDQNYVELFNTPISKGKRTGMLRGSPICMGCWVLRDLKLKPINTFKKTIGGESMSYIGLAKDEENRIARMAGGQISLLERYGYTEADAAALCERFGLLSPIYEFAPRNGCFFCPNAKEKELKHLRKHHPGLWAKLLEMESMPGVVRKTYNWNLRLSDMERDFDIDDRQVNFLDVL